MGHQMFEEGMVSISVALALVVAVAVFGFFLGLAYRPDPRPRAPRVRRGGFLHGLDALVDEPGHKAVDALLVALDVDDESADTHLAVGALLRRRGDLDKALRLHQNLLARPQLAREHRERAELEVARDQLAAGELVRAGRMLREIAERKGALQELALEDLLDLYERDREWQDAVDVASRLFQLGHDEIRRRTAHACCALAEQTLDAGNALAARAHFADALNWDEGCVRASLALGRLEGEAGRWRDAIAVLRRFEEQDPRFLSEALPLLATAHRELGAERDFVSLLERWHEAHGSTTVALELADLLAGRSGEAAARKFLADALAARPTVRGLVSTLERERSVDDELGEGLEALRALATRLEDDADRYRCDECGRGGDLLHWQCPDCGAWGTTAPVRGLLGD
jgi:lipopolysaccharide biosynthesis regulator YciM